MNVHARKILEIFVQTSKLSEIMSSDKTRLENLLHFLYLTDTST